MANTQNKPIRCIETGIVYASSHDAARALNLPQSSISHAVNGKRKDVHGYTFEKVDTTTISETTITRCAAATVSATGTFTNKNCKPIMCVETGVIYASGIEAARALEVDPSCVSAVITGKSKTCKGMHLFMVDNIKENIDAISSIIRTLAKTNEEGKAKIEAYDAMQKTKAALSEAEAEVAKHEAKYIQLMDEASKEKTLILEAQSKVINLKKELEK